MVRRMSACRCILDIRADRWDVAEVPIADNGIIVRIFSQDRISACYPDEGMTSGFASPDRVRKITEELLGRELYQVGIDKYHVMFWFEGGLCLLNAAFRFSFRSSDGSLEYIYDVQAPGHRKTLNVESILRHRVTSVEALDERHLALVFDTGDVLIIHDNPKMRSAWFMRFDPKNKNRHLWVEDDEDGEED